MERDAELHQKVDAALLDLRALRTEFNVWKQAVIPMSTGFVGVVGGILLGVFALKG